MKNIITLILFLTVITGFAQDKETQKKVKKISKQACECISEIDVNKSKKEKSEDIETCIHAANLGYQIDDNLLGSIEKIMDSIKKENVIKTDTTVIESGKKITINVSDNYEEIEEYLYENCPSLKNVYFTDNTATENSYSDRKKAMKYYEKGQQAFSNENFEDAVIQFYKALKKDKKFAFAWDNLGFSYRKLGNYKEAIKCYKKSLAIDPKGKMPLMNIAVAYQLDNDLDSAIIGYENYKEVYQNDPEGFYGLGRIFYFKKDYEPALVNMIKAYKLYVEMNSPYNIDAQKHLEFIYQEMNDLGKLEDFKRIAKENNLEVNLED